MLLEAINSPQDIKKLSLEQLQKLAAEVRQRMIEVVSCTGGHLASSLGTVELIIALHYCFDAPKDKIVFDVGHQSYCHKILTGRNKNFATLRQYQGISGFPCAAESAFDVFTSGHSSNAVSLALGLASAAEFLPDDERFKVAALIGDGSISGGLCFEGLNNAGHSKKDILVVLNTNELSIAPNVGALSTYLNKIISLPIYNRFKDALENYARSRIPKGSRLIKLANKFEEGLKGLFIPGMLFEELGFRYFGPFNGHDLNVLISSLRNLSAIRGPKLLHVVTKKGKGYLPAENNPVRFHGAARFEIETGAAVAANNEPHVTSYTEIFSRKLAELAGRDEKIMAVTAAMPEGTGLDRFRDLYPKRFFDVGIAEAHALCFSAGLAKAGLKPLVAVYSTFLQRAYDQIIEDVALQDLAVVLAIDRAGIVGEDGVTHQGIFDIAFLRSIPNVVIMAPANAEELEQMLDFAFNLGKPVAIRYPKEKVPGVKRQAPSDKIQLARAQVLREGKDFAIIALGAMVAPALDAVELLEKDGLRGTLVNARFAKPLDVKLFKTLGARMENVFTVEDGVIDGGFGDGIAEAMKKPVVKLGIPNEFITHGKRSLLLDKFGLNAAGIAKTINSLLRHG